jgi:hypothetical protein
MQPINYMLDVQQPLQMALAGYTQGQGIRANQQGMEDQRRLMEMQEMQFAQQQQAVQQQQARAQEMQMDMAGIADDVASGQFSPARLFEMQAKYPEVGEYLSGLYTNVSEQQKEGMIDERVRFINLVRNNPELARTKLEERRDAYLNSGQTDEAKAIDAELAQMDTAPEAVMLAHMLEVNALMNDPERFESLAGMIMPPAPELPAAVQTFEALAQRAGLQPGTPEYARAAEEAMKGGGTTVTVPVNLGDTLSPGFKKQDELFAQVAVDWKTGGGTDAIKQVSQLADVIDRIDAGESVSGGVQGVTPDIVRAFTNPNALDAQETVEEVVQRNLRVILGAQFTAKEGEQLIRRAFNPRLSPEVNRRRLQRLFTQMEIAAQQKQEMVSYFDSNGTLSGYSGRQPTLSDFYTAIETEGAAPDTGVRLPVINSQAAYDALPSGAKYTTPSGGTRTKP